mmetsp:Transcript_38057/g.94586  ORF Transcript_38057/g.94586 Transcript_38057/m.94586 type:complete len:269 (+) Transcript_38057:3-809(+)
MHALPSPPSAACSAHCITRHSCIMTLSPTITSGAVRFKHAAPCALSKRHTRHRRLSHRLYARTTRVPPSNRSSRKRRARAVATPGSDPSPAAGANVSEDLLCALDSRSAVSFATALPTLAAVDAAVHTSSEYHPCPSAPSCHTARGQTPNRASISPRSASDSVPKPPTHAPSLMSSPPSSSSPPPSSPLHSWDLCFASADITGRRTSAGDTSTENGDPGIGCPINAAPGASGRPFSAAAASAASPYSNVAYTWCGPGSTGSKVMSCRS